MKQGGDICYMHDCEPSEHLQDVNLCQKYFLNLNFFFYSTSRNPMSTLIFENKLWPDEFGSLGSFCVSCFRMYSSLPKRGAKTVQLL